MTCLIDSHAHLSDLSLSGEIDEILARAQNNGVQSIISICTDLATLEHGKCLVKRYPWVYLAASTTPHDVEKEGEEVFPVIVKTAKEGVLKAIGETGLDYYYEHSNREIQKKFLRKYLHLALECDLPVVIHCRDAFTDFFEILDSDFQLNGRYKPGVLHCFTGNRHEAAQVIERGWMLSLSGIVTFKKSILLQEVAKEIPLNQLLIETDAPYLAPQGKRGKKNEPAYLLETAQFLANLRGISLEEFTTATTANAKKLFSL